MAITVRGSPPRVWGQLQCRDDCRRSVRFTPTCVGTTIGARHSLNRLPVHPHVCGDNNQDENFTEQWSGSPPRVWGQLSDSVYGWSMVRFTPTCVGTTIVLSTNGYTVTVHPHVCGDNPTPIASISSTSWFTPRVWGQHRSRCSSRRPRRFTPTCVGTTRRSHQQHLEQPVHPHVCGDNFRFTPICIKSHGSPPRVWGQPGAMYWDAFNPLVHPHVCGDNVVPAIQSCCCDGSPPRVWGQLDDSLSLLIRHRFTPTCVGTTISEGFRLSPDTVHPHVCGDNKSP